MSGFYHRQVAPTRSSGTTIEKVNLELTKTQLDRLINLVENDVADKKRRAAAGELDFGLVQSHLLLDNLKDSCK